MNFTPFHLRTDDPEQWGYVICSDLAEQEAVYWHCAKLGNTHVRHAALNSILLTSATNPCVINVRHSDFKSYKPRDAK